MQAAGLIDPQWTAPSVAPLMRPTCPALPNSVDRRGGAARALAGSAPSPGVRDMTTARRAEGR